MAELTARLADYSTLAAEVAREMSVLIRQRWGTFRVSVKPDRSFVTDVDIEVQQRIVTRLRAADSEVAIIAEESPHVLTAADGEFCWVVDPLDGTRNFIRGIPCVSIALGLLHGGQPVVGVVVDPLCERLYEARLGEGVRLNGEPISSSNGGPLVVGIPSTRRRPLPAVVLQHWAQSMVLRNLGSTALHMGLVAVGAFDACYAQECRLWDVVAGAALISESGGLVCDRRGEPLFPLSPFEFVDREIDFVAGSEPSLKQLLPGLSMNDGPAFNRGQED